MKRIVFIFISIWLLQSFATEVAAQSTSSISNIVDFNAGIGNSEGNLALAMNYEFGLGKKKKMIIGIGGRFTSYFGKNQYYVTAPAELTTGSTGLGVIFMENIEANMDTFLIKSAQVNSLNLVFSLGYNLSEKLSLRFNIDVIGFSFGKSISGNYINGSQGSIESASPTPFNLLLTSDNDHGSLNSELFVRYFLNSKWGLKGGAQFLFTEYTTDTEVQQFPMANDRFRNKSLIFTAGVAYKI